MDNYGQAVRRYAKWTMPYINLQGEECQTKFFGWGRNSHHKLKDAVRAFAL